MKQTCKMSGEFYFSPIDRFFGGVESVISAQVRSFCKCIDYIEKFKTELNNSNIFAIILRSDNKSYL